MAKVYFYLNQGDYGRVKDLTRFEDFTLRHPQLVWSWGTYFRLKERGYDVTLTYEIPESGILVIPAIYLAMMQKPPENVLFICTVADSPPPVYMPVNVTQNPLQSSEYPNLSRFPVWRHVPHWPQPGIIPRNESRGDLFTTVAYFGHRDQLEPELLTADFTKEMARLNVNFEIRETNFYDFSDVDAVVAVRDFSGERHLHKPYTKLVNAWMGQTPAIVGMESSFQSVRQSDLDFLAAGSKAALLAAVLKLKADKKLRRQMVENGQQRVKEFDEESIVRVWEQLLWKDAPAYYKEWQRKKGLSKQVFYLDLFLSRSYRSIKNKFERRLGFG